MQTQTAAPGANKTIKTGWQPSPRIQKLLADHSASRHGLGAERALHYTDFFKKQAKQYKSPALRMAHALKYHLENRTIKIYEDELIVGSHTEHRIGAICYPELSGAIMLEDLFKFAKRKTNPLYVDPRHRGRLLRSVLPYWLSHSLVNKAFSTPFRLKFIWEQLRADRFIVNESGGIAHFCPDYERLIQEGSREMRRKLQSRLLDEKVPGRRDNLEAGIIALDALEGFVERYRALAKEIGRADIADILSRVPYEPAATLQEALQCIWFYQMLIQIESLDQGISFGRIDQYLYPLYLIEIKNGTFKADEFKDLLSAFCIKASEVIPLFSDRFTKLYAGLPSGQAATIGGLTETGHCAANELSLMMLDVIDRIKTRQPNWHARISKESRPDFAAKVFQTIANGGGSPALYNDEVIMPALSQRGFPQKEVWNYATVGCVEPAIPGKSFTSSDAALFNLPRALETLLDNGRRGGGFFGGRFRKKIKRLDQIQTFEDLMAEVKVQIARQADYLEECLQGIEKANADFHPTPFSSLTIQGCLESGKDVSQGGALYNASGIQAVGLADLADSLCAIKELVFEKKQHTLLEVSYACAADFEGFSALRAKMLQAPKFGNDSAAVDAIAHDLAAMYDEIISSRINTRGGRWMPGAYSMTCHQAFGERTGALPSGRQKGETLADGIAPVDDADRLGPTASLNSITRLNSVVFGNGVNLNIKFNSNLFDDPKGISVLSALLRGYFSQGGMQVQVNVLDHELLLDAMKNPDKHKNLLVRVSGYSAYFTDLTPEMQKEIVKRSMHVF